MTSSLAPALPNQKQGSMFLSKVQYAKGTVAPP